MPGGLLDETPGNPAEPAPAKQPAKRQQPDPAEVEGWLTGVQVTELGVTPRALSRWTESGIVQRAKDATGQWRFRPDDIDAARTRTAPPGGAKDEVLDAMRGLVAMLQGHLERSFQLVHDPGLRLLTLLQTENARLAARCEKLEDRHLQFLDLYEKMMTAQHARDLEVKVVDQREARRDKAFSKLTDAAPAFFSQVVAGLGAKRLVESIGDDQLAVLLVAEFLTDEQKGLLKAEQARRAKVKAKADAASEPTASKEAPTEDTKA